MKLFFTSLVLFVLTACSNNEQRFVCAQENNKERTEGLSIKNNVATLGLYTDMKFCDKSGTNNIYASDCGKTKVETYYNIFFDTISYSTNLAVKSKDSYDTYWYQCKKIN